MDERGHAFAQWNGRTFAFAGLRAHHALAGVTICAVCHTADAVQVGEQVEPFNYLPGGGNVLALTDACADAQFGPTGLDNDGDGLDDGADPNKAEASCDGDGFALFGAVALLSNSDDPPDLDDLRAQIIPPAQSWQSVPWETDLAVARSRAFAEGKLLFLWAMNGHPCGCT